MKWSWKVLVHQVHHRQLDFFWALEWWWQAKPQYRRWWQRIPNWGKRGNYGKIFLHDMSSIPSRLNLEDFSLSLPVYSSHGPCNTNTKEHVHSVGAGHITNRGICGLILNSSCLWSKCVWRRVFVKSVTSILTNLNTGHYHSRFLNFSSFIF